MQKQQRFFRMEITWHDPSGEKKGTNAVSRKKRGVLATSDKIISTCNSCWDFMHLFMQNLKRNNDFSVNMRNLDVHM